MCDCELPEIPTGFGDILAMISAGGMCVSTSANTAKRGLKKYCFPKIKPACVLASIYVVVNLVLGIIDAVFEALALNTCSSLIIVGTIKDNATYGSDFSFDATEGVYNGLGLYIWKLAFAVLVSIVLPLEVWLMVRTFYKKETWVIMSGRDPYCLCFKVVENSNKDDKSWCSYMFCMQTAHRLFWVFEDIVHIFISFGKWLFANEGQANLEAFYNNYNYIANIILFTTESITVLGRIASFYYTLPGTCNSRCEKENMYRVMSFFTGSTAWIFCFFTVAADVDLIQGSIGKIVRIANDDASKLANMAILWSAILCSGLFLIFLLWCACRLKSLKRSRRFNQQ